MSYKEPEQELRRRLNRQTWGNHWRLNRPFGDGFIFDHDTQYHRIIVNMGPTGPEEEQADDIWVHASISHQDVMPSYLELTYLHAAVWPDGWSYQVFAPPSAHINIHAFALHLWGRPDGRAELPNFGVYGSI